MKIKSLHIKNFKSLVDLEIVEPNPFTVFVGANGVGKSNIFEALEFHLMTGGDDFKLRVFGGAEAVHNRNLGKSYRFQLVGSTFEISHFRDERSYDDVYVGNVEDVAFSRIFINHEAYQKINYSDSQKLSLSASNLEKVLKRLLSDRVKCEEIKEYLGLLIPEFENIEIESHSLSGSDSLLVYERGYLRPFDKSLISDGTYNILCLLTALYQSDEPQFLCIEEPENGLTPYVIEAFVELIRSKCEENGHYIWLNTHSQTLVRHLTEEELILVDKVEGATKIKQFKKGDFYGLRADEAWLTNALGAGLPW